MFKKYDNLVDEIVSKMTLHEKIGQLNQICYSTDPKTVEKIKDMIRKGEVGSLILADSATAGNDPTSSFNRHALDEFQKVAVNESPNKIPLIFGRDVIYGHKTIYPIPLAQSCSFNPDLIQKCYSNVAKEAASDGIQWSFTPMLDLCRDPRWGRIIESPGEDPFVASGVAKAVIEGIQGDFGEENLVACAKHFIGYGAAEAGRDYHHTEISDYSLYNYYLPAFRSAVDSGVATIMSSFNDINGENVSSSRYYLTDILRDRLGFEGFVVSDWGSVEIALRQGIAETYADCAEMSINAGVDMNMVEGSYIKNLESLVEEGKVSVETIDLAVKRVLRVKMAKKLFENPYSHNIDVDFNKHLIDAEKLALESMVLLKNKDNVLPLKKNEKVALVGPFANERRSLLGSWTLDGKAEDTPNLYEEVCTVLGSENVYTTLQNEADTIVLALGESNKMNGEAHSLSDISVSKEQKELILEARKTGKRVVGVLFFGRPYALEDVEEYFDAILYAWHSGSKAAAAVCDILFGDVSPSGRLSVTFPKKTGHIPIYYNAFRPGKRVNAYYTDVWEGFYNACYIDGLAQPMYPFGFGLTYSKFNYGEIITDKTEIPLENLLNGEKFNIKISVENVGDFTAKETIQLYICDKVASIMRPNRELKAYEKAEIKVGEARDFEFEVGFNQLGFYKKNGEYIVEKGEFDIFIGKNCLSDRKITVSII